MICPKRGIPPAAPTLYIARLCTVLAARRWKVRHPICPGYPRPVQNLRLAEK